MRCDNKADDDTRHVHVYTCVCVCYRVTDISLPCPCPVAAENEQRAGQSWLTGQERQSKPELTRTKGYKTFTNKFHIYVHGHFAGQHAKDTGHRAQDM